MKNKFLLLKISIVFLILMFLSGCVPKDTTPPSVSITSPLNNATVSGSVDIIASATDDVGVSKVEFYIDGTKVGEDTQSPYVYSWNTDSLQYGSTHGIKAKAYDNAGNTGESQIVTVTIGDTQAPQITITNPNNGDTVSGIVSIEATVVDKIPSAKNKKVEKAPSGILKVEFYVDGTKVGEDSQAPYEYSWNTDLLQYGSTHSIKAKAYDNAGNTGESQIVTVTIGDTQAPQVTITNPN
ncbi:MAG TPA: Ig-like domain-containing protein, partial [Dictyoglomaceae bacterium]|nr:Ig-like domain-containing protein [Dictyoglomaceae bacterium]